MTTFKAHRGNFLRIATVLLCICPAFAWGDGETAGTSFSDSLTTNSSGSNGTSTTDLGTGIFSHVPIHVSLSLQGGYDNNVSTSTSGGQESWFANAGAVVTYNFGSPRTQLGLTSTLALTYYPDTSVAQYDPNLNLSLTVTHKASPRLTLSATSYTSYQAEPDFQYAVGSYRRVGNFFFTQDRLGAAYMWTPRFSTQTSYIFGAVHYDESAIGISNDRIENTIGNEFRFLVWPTTNLIAEYRFQIVNYQYNDNDSTTQFILVGFDHAFSSRLTATFRGGAEFRSYQNSGDQNSPYFESTVNYALGQRTSVAWTNRYGIENGDATRNENRTTFRTGLTANHNLTSRIAAVLSAYYAHDTYSSISTPGVINPSFMQDSFDLNLSLRYSINRYLGLSTGLDYSKVTSDSTFSDYSRTRVWGGFNFIF